MAPTHYPQHQHLGIKLDILTLVIVSFKVRPPLDLSKRSSKGPRSRENDGSRPIPKVPSVPPTPQAVTSSCVDMSSEKKPMPFASYIIAIFSASLCFSSSTSHLLGNSNHARSITFNIAAELLCRRNKILLRETWASRGGENHRSWQELDTFVNCVASWNSQLTRLFTGKNSFSEDAVIFSCCRPSALRPNYYFACCFAIIRCCWTLSGPWPGYNSVVFGRYRSGSVFFKPGSASVWQARSFEVGGFLGRFIECVFHDLDHLDYLRRTVVGLTRPSV